MSRPRVYCDFNDHIAPNMYGLRVLGTVADLERQRLELVTGLEVTLYDYDGFENGDPAWIIADATVVHEPAIGFVAQVDASGFRWEVRAERQARIHWSDELLRHGLPQSTELIDPAWFEGESSDEGWSLVCKFASPPRELGSPSSAMIRFLVAEAPHARLARGVRLRLFERATQAYATVEVLE